jgi:hypothetical protein
LIRFVWELMWGILGIVMIVLGLTGQMEGGAGYDIFGVVIGIGLVGWSYWKWQAKRISKGTTAPLIGGHRVLDDKTNNSWTCREEDCGWSGYSRRAARSHRIATGAIVAAAAPTSATGIASPAPVQAQPHATETSHQPEFKTCPDCAEEVRFAARKCRFCGFEFTK